MPEGWIKLHRSLLNHMIFDNPKLLKVWNWCLLKARHEQGEIYFVRQKVFLQPGQFVFGRKKAAQELGMPPTTVWDYMKILEADRSIDISSTARYSIISITNWAHYQSSPTDVPCAGRTEKDTNKNVKKEKINITAPNAREQSELKKAIEKISFNPKTQQWENITQADIDGWQQAYPACDIEVELNAMKQWLLSNPTKTKSNYRRFITNWLTSRQNRGGTHMGKLKLDSYDRSMMEVQNSVKY